MHRSFHTANRARTRVWKKINVSAWFAYIQLVSQNSVESSNCKYRLCGCTWCCHEKTCPKCFCVIMSMQKHQQIQWSTKANFVYHRAAIVQIVDSGWCLSLSWLPAWEGLCNTLDADNKATAYNWQIWPFSCWSSPPIQSSALRKMNGFRFDGCQLCGSKKWPPGKVGSKSGVNYCFNKKKNSAGIVCNAQ